MFHYLLLTGLHVVSGLSLKAGGQGFSLAIASVSPGYFGHDGREKIGTQNKLRQTTTV